MVSRQEKLSKLNLNVASKVEPKLSIQSFRQCSSLISLKLDSSNYLLWRTQLLLLIRSFGILHHITDENCSLQSLAGESNSTTINPNYAQ